MFEIHHGQRLIKSDRIAGKTPFLTAGQENQGVACYIGNKWEKYINPITVDMFGNCFFHNGIYSGDDNIYFFTSDKISNKSKLFIVNCILRQTMGKYSYGKQFRQPNADNLKALLPMKDGKIDFKFMESFIDELGTQRIAELEVCQTSELSAYLTASGFNNYDLSEEEIKSLQEYPDLEFAEFDILDIFTIKNTSNILSSDIVEGSGKTPYLCASADNNSVKSYIKYNEQYLEQGNCIFIGGKTFVVSYQEKDFYSNDSHNLALYLNNQAVRTKLNQLYIATCVYKSLSHQYSWGNSVSKAKIKGDKILLPTKDGVVDFDAMETFVSAIQKLVIKDVVMDSDVKIDATKRVVLNNS